MSDNPQWRPPPPEEWPPVPTSEQPTQAVPQYPPGYGPTGPTGQVAGYPPPGYGPPGQTTPIPAAAPPGYGPPGQPNAAFAPPSYQPPGYQPPGYQAPGYGPAPFSGGTGGPAGRPGGRRSMLAAGVVGGLAVLGLIAAATYAVTRPDDDPPTSTTLDAAGTSTTTIASTAPPEDPARIGTTVAGIDLRNGDCLDFDDSGGNISEFDIISCTSPHLAEITAQLEHPSAGQAYPGTDELAVWSRDRCAQQSTTFLGADPLDTTLYQFALLPDFNDWAQGLYRVSCMIAAYDGTDITGTVRGQAAAYPRGDRVFVQRLKPGDCFSGISGGSGLDVARTDQVLLTDCSQTHTGYFFGRGVLDFGSGDVYPGQEAVDTAAVELCDREFSRWFGASPLGVQYRYWSPDDVTWNTGDRAVDCVILDETALPAELDYENYVAVHDLTVGACFPLPPDETKDSLGLSDRVKTVDCNTPYNGQMFFSGEFPAGDYPGDETLDAQVIEECSSRFAAFVGVEPSRSALGDYTYWVPTAEGWAAADYRYACIVLVDQPRTGTAQNTNS